MATPDIIIIFTAALLCGIFALLKNIIGTHWDD